MKFETTEITIKGKPIEVISLHINNNEIICTGKKIKLARVKDEWFNDISHPELLIAALQKSQRKPDIFTFWQRLPDTTPKYDYYLEWESITALYIESFDHWWKEQISPETRNKIRKAKKKGVSIRIANFDDEFVRGIMEIFNETPIRRGKPFWHYGKDFKTVKKEWSRDSEKSDFIGAYYNENLIGFMKLVYSNNLAEQVQNLSKLAYRNKYPNNALIAKAVEICDAKNIPYLTYGAWRRGSHAEFLRRHGFEKILLPRYYIPLTPKGKLVLRLKLHKGLAELIPEDLKEKLLALREKWYSAKFSYFVNKFKRA